MISFQSLRQQLGILPKLPTILGIFCKVAEVFHFSCRNHFWATFIDIWRLFSGHTGCHALKMFPIAGEMAKVGSKLNEPLKMAKVLSIFCQNGELFPNLVTLLPLPFHKFGHDKFLIYLTR